MQYMKVGRKSVARLQAEKVHKITLKRVRNSYDVPDSDLLPGIVLDAAQSQAEGHIPTQLLR